MLNRYVQVSRTYCQRWLFRILLIPTAIFVLLILLSPPVGWSVSSANLVPLAAVAAWWAASIVAHAKEQLADPRSTLLPRFRTPHVIVVVGALALFVLVLPMAIAGSMEPLSRLGVGAVVMFFAMITAWLAYLQSAPAIGIWLAIFLLVGSKAVRRELMDILVGSELVGGWGLLAVAIGGFAALIARLSLINEEMREYWRQPVPMWSLRPAMTGDRSLRLAAADTGSLNALITHRSYRLHRIRNIYDAGFWRRIRHWRLVTGTGWSPWLITVFLGAWTAIMPLFAHPRDRLSIGQGIGLAMMFLPLPLVAFSWIRRWPSLGYELTRPCTRAQFLLEMGTAMALDLAETFLAVIVGGLIPAALWAPEAAFCTLLSPLYVFLALANFLVFAVFLWVLRLRIGWLSVMTIVIGAIATVVVAAWSQMILALVTAPRHATYSQTLNLSMLPATLAIAMAGGLLLGGTLILGDAFGRWCRTDLD